MDGIERRPPSVTIDEVSEGPGTVIVGIEGELDLASVPAIELELEPMVSSGSDRVTFDLSRVTFMDSSGIAMLLRIAERVPSIEVREPSAAVQLIIQATGLSEVLRAGL
jgi:anti-sigma B factor antagonist